MFTHFMISKAFRGFSRRAIRIFSRSVIGVPCVGIGDGTRCTDRLQRVRSLDEVRSGSISKVGARNREVCFAPRKRLMHRSKLHLHSTTSSAMASGSGGELTEID